MPLSALQHDYSVLALEFGEVEPDSNCQVLFGLDSELSDIPDLAFSATASLVDGISLVVVNNPPGKNRNWWAWMCHVDKL